MRAEPDHLPDPIGDAMVSRTDPERMRRMWLGVDRLREARVRRRTRALRGVGVAVAASVLIAVGYVGGHREAVTSRGAVEAPDRALTSSSRPLRLSDGRQVPTALEAPQELSLDDGSSMTLRDGRLEVVENRATDFVLLLREGSARFRVQPGTGRGWWIECGLATVRVVGTRFELERSEGTLRVSVEEGTVAVRSSLLDDGVRMLRAGDALELVETRFATATGAPAEASGTPSTSRAPDDESPAGWMRWAQSGDYARAWRALGDRGIAQRSRTASAAELLTLADVARRSGHDAAAIPALERLLERHPEDPDAALGAFTLGRIHDRLGHPGPAADAFDRALALRLPSSLVDDALARLAQAHAAAGARDRAAEAAERYLRSRPDGPRADAMRRIIARR